MAQAINITTGIREAELIACIPHLRAFALFRTRNRDQADDLVQDTIVRALAAAHQFQAGTNLKAWMFTILRNLHCNEYRRSRVPVQSLDDPATREPSVAPSQEAGLEFADFCRAFWQLGADRREALILIGASGLSCEEAAKVCDCAMGTIKSRVSRGRAELRRILEDGFAAGERADTPTLANYVSDLLSNPRAGSPTPSLAA